MDTEWPIGFAKQGTLRISTIGRRTGGRHTVSIWFAVDSDGRLLVATQDKRRDWARNAMKNPSVEVTIGGTARKMRVLPLMTDSDRQHVSDLYARKYLSARIGRLFMRPENCAHYEAYELQPE